MNSSRFQGELILRALKPTEQRWVSGSTQLYELVEPFAYMSVKFGCVEAPAGLLTDFASVPAAVHWVIDSDHRGILFGSVIHDYLYSVQGDIGTRIFTRQEADEILREAMEVCGANSFQRAVVYRALRLAGGRAWGV